MLARVLATILRGVIAYILALFLTRLMGRKLISQMTFFDFVVGVSFGSLAANMAIGSERNSESVAITLSVFASLEIITGLLDIKSFVLRKKINSEPVTIIENGNIVEDNMKRTRLTINELNMKLREKNMFSLADVEFAVLETDGQVSVLPKPDKEPLTPSHMHIRTSSTGLMRDVIIDGNIMEENLRGAGLDAEWLQSQLNAQGIKMASEVFYAGLDNSKKLYLSKRNGGRREKQGQYGME